MCRKWNVQNMKCAENGRCKMWNVQSLECENYKMCKECAYYGLCKTWNMQSIDCTKYGMCWTWNVQNIQVANVHKIECAQFWICKKISCAQFRMYIKWMCRKLFDPDQTFWWECRRRIRRRESVISELLIKIFILNTNHKLNTIPPHTQRARLGAIGTHVSEMKKWIYICPIVWSIGGGGGSVW